MVVHIAEGVDDAADDGGILVGDVAVDAVGPGHDLVSIDFGEHQRGDERLEVVCAIVLHRAVGVVLKWVHQEPEARVVPMVGR